MRDYSTSYLLHSFISSGLNFDPRASVVSRRIAGAVSETTFPRFNRGRVGSVAVFMHHEEVVPEMRNTWINTNRCLDDLPRLGAPSDKLSQETNCKHLRCCPRRWSSRGL